MAILFDTPAENGDRAFELLSFTYPGRDEQLHDSSKACLSPR